MDERWSILRAAAHRAFEAGHGYSDANSLAGTEAHKTSVDP